MTTKRANSRDRILEAAGELAGEIGPGHVSLDAVAKRAGVSKGGLLYNFPTKASLMEGLVERYVSEVENALETASKAKLMAAYVDLCMRECAETRPQASGMLAALAENPDFLKPIRAFKRRVLDRLKTETDDLPGLLLAFLALEGLRSLTVFDLDVLTPAERETVHAVLAGVARQTA
ncbi:MAG: TetR/AcrR family transcriptional regulator [Rhizobiaceae bacterium]